MSKIDDLIATEGAAAETKPRNCRTMREESGATSAAR